MKRKREDISHEFDSSDEGQPAKHTQFVVGNENYLSILQEGINGTKYPISYILTELGNRLLLSNEITEKYLQVKDPLQSKINTLEKKSFISQGVLKGVESLNSNIQNKLLLIEALKKIVGTEELIASIAKELEEAKQSRNKWIEDHLDYLDKLRGKGIISNESKDEELIEEIYQIYNRSDVDIKDELEIISELQYNRNELNKVLKGAFPFIPKQLTLTFINEYNETMKVICNKEEITLQLAKVRNNLDYSTIDVSDYHNKLCELFDIEVKLKKNNQYTKQTQTTLLSKIKSVIGRGPSEKDIDEYYRLNKEQLLQDESFKLTSSNNENVANYIKNKVNNYVSNNAKKIYEVLKKSEEYTTDPDYLKELSNQDFLVQVRAYRKLHRDVQKNILLSGDEGKRNVPPGPNTTIEITAGGSSKFYLGELGSYSEIGEKHLETLKSYGAYVISNKQIEEKEKELKTLAQIEAIRSTSALLTNPMFFELAAIKFKSARIFVENEYSFSNIAEQMPMTMSGAVSGSVYLEQEFQDKLTGKLPYDYREEGKKTNADVLDSRNKKILFDWLSSKINGKNIQDALNKLNDNNTPKIIKIDNVGWSITILEKDNLILQNQEGYKVTFKRNEALENEIREDIENNIKSNLKFIFKLEKGIVKLELSVIGKYVVAETETKNIYEIRDQNNNELAKFGIKIIEKSKKKSEIIVDKLELCRNIQEITKNFCLTEFDTLPTKILNWLIEKWYKITLSYLEDKTLEVILKAAAEPNNYHYYKDDEDQNNGSIAAHNNLSTEHILPIINSVVDISNNILNLYALCSEPWVQISGDISANEILVSG